MATFGSARAQIRSPLLIYGLSLGYQAVHPPITVDVANQVGGLVSTADGGRRLLLGRCGRVLSRADHSFFVCAGLAPQAWAEALATPARCAVGDRAPDTQLSDAATGAPRRLFELFRGPQFTLLAFGGAQATLAEHLATEHPGLIRSCSIAAPDDGNPDCALTTLVDPRSSLRRLYGVAERALVLVRPDGYVGFWSSPASPSVLRSYLQCTLGLLPASTAGTAATDRVRPIVRNYPPVT